MKKRDGLTSAQVYALKSLADGGYASHSPTNPSLCALERRGLADKKFRPEFWGYCDWFVTEEGTKWLEAKPPAPKT